jgi:hypothetical protein
VKSIRRTDVEHRARDRVLLTQAAGSPGLRREDAACRRMPKGGEISDFFQINELQHLGPLLPREPPALVGETRGTRWWRVLIETHSEVL